MLDAFIPALTVLKEVNKSFLYFFSFFLNFLFREMLMLLPFFLFLFLFLCFHEQKLDAGDDPLTAFLLSSEAAMYGAESTKDMHAQVIYVFEFC